MSSFPPSPELGPSEPPSLAPSDLQRDRASEDDLDGSDAGGASDPELDAATSAEASVPCGGATAADPEADDATAAAEPARTACFELPEAIPEAIADEFEPGDVLDGRYQIEERIGEGGVGFVYRALQLVLNRSVAVKLLQRDAIGEEELRPRFHQEALTLAALSHPNIVSLQDYGVANERPFLVMELLEGRTLREIIDEEGPVAPARALGLLRQLVLALAYAHELGIVHRDLKPANLIVQTFPGYEHVTVLDFGLVKLLPGSNLDRGLQLTRAGFTFGTPAYMSPEHALGAEVDGRSDLYSVGVLLFELLTGQKPFDGEIQDILRHHLSTPVPRLADRRQELAELSELQDIIDRAMAKELEQRFASAIELLHAFDDLLMSGMLAPALPEGVALAEDEGEGRGSLPPKVREALESAAVALSSYARTSREVWRDKASPQLARAGRELRALALRLAPHLRGLSQAAWAQLRPRMASAAERIALLASEAKQRLESHRERLALPAGTKGEPPTGEPLADATILDMPHVAGDAGDDAVSASAEALPSAQRHDATIAQTQPTVAQPTASAADTAEPLVLEPRESKPT